MKLSAPKGVTFLIAFLVGVVAIVGMFVSIPYVSAYATYLLIGAFALLVLACVFKGL